MKTAVNLRVRFSNEKHQKESSIDHQVALCKTWAAREGYHVVGTLLPIAGSASCDRVWPDRMAQKLIEGAQAGKFEAVIVECFDRVSRDQHDIAGAVKRLLKSEIEFQSVNDGLADGDGNPGFRGDRWGRSF